MCFMFVCLFKILKNEVFEFEVLFYLNVDR